ncbi:MAG: NAD(P)H-hydrate dehydratase [Cellvibrionales bacterium]|jgi:NAD(P)H-hydrate epimerase
MTKPRYLYSGNQVREMDRQAVAGSEVSGWELMERAGRSAFALLAKTWQGAEKLRVICGTGNNGGDGWVVARLAREAGWQVAVELVGDKNRIEGDARRALRAFEASGGGFNVRAADEPVPQLDADILVDALCGTGAAGPLRAGHIAWVEAMNSSGIPIFAMDVPTGLNADTGLPEPVATKAAVTVTFIAEKKGLVTGSAGDFVGQLRLEALDLPISIPNSKSPAARVSHWPDLIGHLPLRRVAHHKGLSGHVLVIGGNTGFSGAGILAARAALRSGAGLVSLATRPATAQAAVTVQPEIMAHAIDEVAQLMALLKDANCVVVGPGLGRDAWARMCLTAVLEHTVVSVFDADALNLLSSGDPECLRGREHILTPHPGEAARLLGLSNSAVVSNRFWALQQLVERWQGICVLKGYGTLLGGPGQMTRVCPYGNPGMATGGMGDVLAGLLGSLVAQGLEPFTATELAVSAHGIAGDRAARQGQRGLLASDVIDGLRGVLAGQGDDQ